MELLAVQTVGERLRTDDTRAATLDGLDAMLPPISRELALAAAPALVDVAGDTDDRETFARCALLVARVMAEAAPEPSVVYSAAFSGERYKKFLVPRCYLETMQRALRTERVEGGQLTCDEARSFACRLAVTPPAFVRGLDAPISAAGHTVTEYFSWVRSVSRCLQFLAGLTHLISLAGVLILAAGDGQPDSQEANGVRRCAAEAADPDSRAVAITAATRTGNRWGVAPGE